MPHHIPAVCDDCGAMFPSGLVFENARNVTLAGNRSGPCPNCGGMGHIPDGVYDFVDGAITLLRGPERTVSELQRLAAILRRARDQQAHPSDVAKSIREELPEISSLADLLPKSRADLYAVAALLLATIGLLVDAEKPSDAPPIRAEQVIEQVINILPPPTPPPATPRPGTP